MYTEIANNKRRTAALLIGFVAFITVLGWVMSQALGRPGLLIALAIFALLYAIVGYYAAARIALGLSGARAISKADAPELYRVVENLTIAAGLPMPQVYLISDASPNAFATGRDPAHAAVCVTSGLLE